MTTSVLPRPAQSQPTGLSGITWSVTLVLAGWFLLVASLAAVGAFVVPLGTPPIPIAIGVGAPLIAFFAWAATKLTMAKQFPPRLSGRGW